MEVLEHGNTQVPLFAKILRGARMVVRLCANTQRFSKPPPCWRPGGL